jgi:hypothetical protein
MHDLGALPINPGASMSTIIENRPRFDDAEEAPMQEEHVKALLARHIGSFRDNDLDTVMSDYTDESVLVTADATYAGSTQIRAFFAGLFPQFPKHGTLFVLDRMIIEGGIAFIVWHADTPTLRVPLASDTFVFKDGKIHRQTFVGELRPA